MSDGGSSALRRNVQALLDCGMICEEEVAFLFTVIAEQEAEQACRRGAGCGEFARFRREKVRREGQYHRLQLTAK